MIHTAAWPEDFSAEGKTVAVIGNGASGVQVLPQILPRKDPSSPTPPPPPTFAYSSPAS